MLMNNMYIHKDDPSVHFEKAMVLNGPKRLCMFVMSLAFLATIIRLWEGSMVGNKKQKSKAKDGVKREPFMAYPHDVNMTDLLMKLENNQFVNVTKINTHNFTFIMNPLKKCEVFKNNEKDVNSTRVLIIIKSTPDNFHLRQWLRPFFRNHSHIRSFFVIANSNTQNEELKTENEMYDDIIQMSFLDTYRNLTLKTMMAYEWVSRHCQNADYILFQDDDFMINITNLFSFLRKQKNPKTVFFGHLIKGGWIIYRDPKHKWYMSKTDYPYSVLPPYFPGGAYVVSMDIVKKLVLTFPYVKSLPIDDVYIGMASAKLGITLTDSKLFQFDNCTQIHKNIACKSFTTVAETLKAWKESQSHRVLLKSEKETKL